MKKILTVIAAVSCVTTLLQAQGTVTFDTSANGASAKVLEAVGYTGAGTPLGNTAAGMVAGTQFLMQLYAANGTVTSSSALTPVGNPVNSRGGANNGGYSQILGTTTLGWAINTTVNVTDVNGGPATLQLRAWWAGADGKTYPAYYETGSGAMRYGASSLFTLAVTGNPNGNPPSVPVGLTGLTGFQLVPVPEPSTFALLGLGALGMLVFRRK